MQHQEMTTTTDVRPAADTGRNDILRSKLLCDVPGSAAYEDSSGVTPSVVRD